MVSKLHRFADNKCISISEAFFDKEDDQDSPGPQLTEEKVNELCQALEYSAMTVERGEGNPGQQS